MKKKILYFDDEAWQAEPLAEVLRSSGVYDVKFVSTLVDFFNELESQVITYNLFMLDVMIPTSLFNNEIFNKLTTSQIRRLNDGLDTGIVLFEIIRQDERYTEVPVIFYTAKRVQLIEDGNIRWITKPIVASGIEKAIQELISR